MKKFSLMPVGVAVTSAALLLAGCSGASDGAGPGKPKQSAFKSGPFGKTDPSGGGSPVGGGSLTFGYGGGIASFDPSTEQYSGTSGGDEALAVYGSLAEYDNDASKYVPGMAASIEPNGDFTKWTVGLRDGVKFTDGTAYDAEAVKFNMDRLAGSGDGWSSLWKNSVKGVAVKDPKKVVITLSQPWADFPFLLSQAPGMIASPKAVKAKGGEYLRNPVGAGPFTLKQWTPGQSVVLAANPDYWDGKPHLDTLKFQTITSGDQALSDALKAGGIQGSLISTPAILKPYLASGSGFSGNIRMTNTGSMALINNGTPNRPAAPGRNPDVRQAIAAAINPEVIDQRAFEGQGFPGTGIFQPTSEWANKTPTPKYDLAAAKKHLAAAKAAGYDGNIEVLYMSAQPEAALTVQAQLQAAGFKVTTKPVQAITDMVGAVLIKREYDLAMYGWPVPDEPGELFTAYMERFGRKNNQLGYYNATVNKALNDFAATDDRTKKAASLATVQAEWTRTVPAVPYNSTAQMAVWADSVHGVTMSSRVALDFSKAWIAK